MLARGLYDDAPPPASAAIWITAGWVADLLTSTDPALVRQQARGVRDGAYALLERQDAKPPHGRVMTARDLPVGLLSDVVDAVPVEHGGRLGETKSWHDSGSGPRLSPGPEEEQ
jgi:hypothetical protein